MRKIVKVAINVPSGKLICGNDFRDQYPMKDDFYINETLGIKQTIEAYGALGLFHGFCGNSCPGIYQKGNTISIASPEYNEKTGKEIDPGLGKDIGSICTDLWWYSIADYDDFIKRGGQIDDYTTIINVKPGRYILSHDLYSRSQEGGLEKYATITKSNKKIKSWKMLEEDAAKKIFALLPTKYLSTKIKKIPPHAGYTIAEWKKMGYDKHKVESYIYVNTAFKKAKDKAFVKCGYKIWGLLFDGSKQLDFKILVKSKQLKKPKSILNKIFEYIKDDQEHEKLVNKYNNLDVSKLTTPQIVEYSKFQKTSLKRLMKFTKYY